MLRDIGSRLRFVIRLKTGTASPDSMGGTVPERHNPFFLNKKNTSEILAENTERSSPPEAVHIVIVAPASGLSIVKKEKSNGSVSCDRQIAFPW